MNRDLAQCSHGVFYSDRIDQTKKTPFWDRPPPFLRVWMTAPPLPPPLIWRYGFATAIKEALKSFFLPFRFQMYCSCINYIHVLSFSQLTLENVYKISENVSFCYCTEITIALKKMYPQKIVYEVDQELGGGVLSPARLRVGKIPPEKEKKSKFPGDIPGRHIRGGR